MPNIPTDDTAICPDCGEEMRMVIENRDYGEYETVYYCEGCGTTQTE